MHTIFTALLIPIFLFSLFCLIFHRAERKEKKTADMSNVIEFPITYSENIRAHRKKPYFFRIIHKTNNKFPSALHDRKNTIALYPYEHKKHHRK